MTSANVCADFFDPKDEKLSRHRWAERASAVEERQRQLDADVFALQELSPAQALYFCEKFPDYEGVFLSQTPSDIDAGVIARGAEVADWVGKYVGTALIGTFVRKGCLIKTGRFWLNEEPHKVPTARDRAETDKGFGNMNTYRAVLWVKVADSKSKKRKALYVFNSHYPLSGDGRTRFECARVERREIDALVNEASGAMPWVSCADRNLIFRDTDGEYTTSAIHKELIKDCHDSQEAKHHYGPALTWLGFSYDSFKTPLSDASQWQTLDTIMSSVRPLNSFCHPGALVDGQLLSLEKYPDALKDLDEQRAFASDHCLIGVDLPK